MRNESTKLAKELHIDVRVKHSLAPNNNKVCASMQFETVTIMSMNMTKIVYSNYLLGQVKFRVSRENPIFLTIHKK